MSKAKKTDAIQPTLFDKVATVTDIVTREPDSKEIWYGHSILTSALFPATPPAAGVDFVSKDNGPIEYFLEAGVDRETRRRKFPSGKYPRLLMAWMAKQIRSAGGRKTATVDPETHTIIIPTIHQLCEDMGVTPGGNTSEKVREQLRLLLACRISVQQTMRFTGQRVQDVVYLPIIKAKISM